MEVTCIDAKLIYHGTGMLDKYVFNLYVFLQKNLMTVLSVQQSTINEH